MNSYKISTGWFGRPQIIGKQGPKNTKVHIVQGGITICSYRPHKSMQFQWCANGIYIEYVECQECKKKHKTTFEILEWKINPKDENIRYFVHFYKSLLGVDVDDVVKGASKRNFVSKEEALEWAKKCSREYNTFINKVNK